MGSHLELQAVSWRGRDEGQEKPRVSPGSLGRPGEHRGACRQPGGHRDSDGSPATLDVPCLALPGEAGSPGMTGCLLQTGDSSLGHQSSHTGQSAWPSPLQGQTAPGRDNPHPSLPPLLCPHGLWQSSLPSKISCQQSCNENYNKSFPRPSPGGKQEDRGDLRAEGALARRGHTPHAQVCPLPRRDASCCLPKRCLLQSGFSHGVLFHTSPVLRGLFSLLSCAGSSWPPDWQLKTCWDAWTAQAGKEGWLSTMLSLSLPCALRCWGR